MSRIGKKPVQIPAGVTVTVDGTHVTVKGPKGELDRTFSELLVIEQEGEEILVKVPRTPGTEDLSHEDFKLTKSYKAANAMQGLTRTLIHNMVVGVSEGFEKKLEMTGVGYRAALKGTEFDTGINLEAFTEIRNYFMELRKKYIDSGLLDTKILTADTKALLYQVPGGMLSNLISQLKQAGKEDQLEECLAEVPRVRNSHFSDCRYTGCVQRNHRRALQDGYQGVQGYHRRQVRHNAHAH